ncbi:hypothetical protein [Micromonospora costi]|uniref:hypothetical protein n=1 Tax=Micromonospora costi TaxID=1530042 RepID=UPI0011C41C84|nr:hypothetical protein [Micromonospora costi]
MARNYAQIFCAIWRDPDFIALRESTQRAYLMVVTQPGISAAGVLPLTLRRWVKLAEDSTSERLRADIAHLEAVGMVFVDEDTEELLVRSFVRHDNGYRNPRRQPSIRDAAAEVESPRLRASLAAELVRLGCPPWMPEMATVTGVTPEVPAPGNGYGDDPVGAMASQLDSQPNSHSDSHSGDGDGIDRMPIELAPARTATPNPQPPTHNPDRPSDGLFTAPPAATPASKAPRGPRRATRIPDDFEVTEGMAAWAAQQMPHVNVQTETDKFRDYWRAKAGKDATKTDWPATWRNWMRTAAERSPNVQGRRSGGPLNQPYRNQDSDEYTRWVSQ